MPSPTALLRDSFFTLRYVPTPQLVALARHRLGSLRRRLLGNPWPARIARLEGGGGAGGDSNRPGEPLPLPSGSALGCGCTGFWTSAASLRRVLFGRPSRSAS